MTGKWKLRLEYEGPEGMKWASTYVTFDNLTEDQAKHHLLTAINWIGFELYKDGRLVSLGNNPERRYGKDIIPI